MKWLKSDSKKIQVKDLLDDLEKTENIRNRVIQQINRDTKMSPMNPFPRDFDYSVFPGSPSVSPSPFNAPPPSTYDGREEKINYDSSTSIITHRAIDIGRSNSMTYSRGKAVGVRSGNEFIGKIGDILIGENSGEDK